MAGHQHGVGQELRQLAQVARPAVGQVLVRLRGDARRDAGQRHQRRVRDHLAAEDDQRERLAPQRREPLAPGLLAAQQAHHDHVGAVEQRREIGRVQARRVGQPVVRAAGLGGQQVGVGRGQQQDSASLGPADTTGPPRDPRPGSKVAAAGVSWLPDRCAPRPSRPNGPWPCWGLLPGDSGGTAPDSHRLPRCPSRVPADSGVHRARTSNHSSLVSLPATWGPWDLSNPLGVLGTEGLMQLGWQEGSAPWPGHGKRQHYDINHFLPLN